MPWTAEIRRNTVVTNSPHPEILLHPTHPGGHGGVRIKMRKHRPPNRHIAPSPMGRLPSRRPHIHLVRLLRTFLRGLSFPLLVSVRAQGGHLAAIVCAGRVSTGAGVFSPHPLHGGALDWEKPAQAVSATFGAVAPGAGGALILECHGKSWVLQLSPRVLRDGEVPNGRGHANKRLGELPMDRSPLCGVSHASGTGGAHGVSSVTTTPSTDVAMSVCPTAPVSRSRKKAGLRTATKRTTSRDSIRLPPHAIAIFASNGNG